jgi:tetratricopeptide (TPR) repeat protein
VTPIGSEALPASPAAAAGEVLGRLRRGIQDPRDLNPLVGKRLSHLLLKCLAFEPIDRFATMREVHHALKADRYSLASLIRKARVRPVLFAALYVAPVILLLSSAIYAVTRPPSFEQDYVDGLTLLSSNNTAAAIDKFNAAIIAKPSYSAARFELARARLAAGETHLAKNDFAILANREHHLPSLAYLAYCLDLEQGYTEAIPLWERVKAAGLDSLAIRNNLAASYLAGSSIHSLKDRLRIAESELAAAYAIDPSSRCVNLNLVRLAVKKAKSDPQFNPFTAWRAARSALNAPEPDPSVRLHVALWWSQVRQFRRVHNIQAPDSNTAELPIGSFEAKTAEASFQALFDSLHPDFDDNGQIPAIFEQQLRGNHLFLEPR